MPYKRQIWCAHLYHDEVLPNRKTPFWKTGLKPSYLKEIRSINEEMAEFINNHNEAIINGSSKKVQGMTVSAHLVLRKKRILR